MKKLIVLAGILMLASSGYCVNQPQNIGYVSTDGPFGLYNRTLAQMNALQSDTTGQLLYVSDAVMSRICVSSGSFAAGQWVVGSGTGTFSGGTYPHCQ